MKKTLIFILCLLSNIIMAQEAISVVVGSGSYASRIPNVIEGTNRTNLVNFLSQSLNVLPGETRPIPTNDWWTDLLIPKATNNFSGFLHSYPVTILPKNYGCDFFFLNRWVGQDMAREDELRIRGTNGFAPLKNVAKNWNDWGLTVNLQNGTQSMDVTMNNGSPMAWFEINGFDPIIEFKVGTTFFKTDGTAQAFPFTGNNFGALHNGKLYAIYTPDGTQFSIVGTTVTMTMPIAGKKYFTVATLKSQPDLTAFSAFAYVIPRDTKVTSMFQPTSGTITNTWSITTENLKNGTENRIIQGFLPHQYKRCQTSVAFNSQEYATPRGSMKYSIGNSFSFTYDFKGITGFVPQPIVQAHSNPYDVAKLNNMLNYLANNSNLATENETYAGTKQLFNRAKSAWMANEVGNTVALNTLKLQIKQALVDWLTYTPGEVGKYFAREDNFKSLIGFKPGFGSENFNDHHFHYGYLIYAAALYGMMDKTFLDQYGPMLKLVTKEYANWDRTDNNFPYLRTFSPWKGMSYAGGVSSGDGNNQESSSEAVCSWAGMYLLADLLGDADMRNTAAFGYVSETRAVREYYLDVDGTNFPPSFPHKSIGILWERGMQYGTYFTAEPAAIHGIQWLPQSVAMTYLAEYPTYLQSEYAIMLADQQPFFTQNKTNNPTQYDVGETLTDYNLYFPNPSLNFQQIYNPSDVAQKLDAYWATYINPTGTKVSGKIANLFKDEISSQTYFNTHSHRSLGDISFTWHTSAPNSQVYFNATTNKYSYVGFNALPTVQTVSVYNNKVFVESFNVPAYSPFFKQSGTVTTTTLPSPWISSDIGTVAPAGSATFATGAFTLKGSGADIWGTADGFQYVYQPWTTDGEIITRIPSLTNTNPNAKAGLMFRETLTAGSKHAFIEFSPNNTIELLSRNVTGGTTAASILPNLVLPQWVKLVKVGNVFTGFYSANGTTWIQVGGPVTIPMSSSVFVGMAVNSHNVGTLATGVFDNVSVNTLASNPNLALNKPITASSIENVNLAANFANDGNQTTRWATVYANAQDWIYVDLGANYNINRVKLNWEGAYAKQYQIQVSTDPNNWTGKTVYTTPAIGSDGAIDDVTLTGLGRYVRILCTQKALAPYGYSLFELEVYGTFSSARIASESAINQESEEDMLIYPNPSKDFLTVYFSGEAESKEISINDMTGKVVLKQKLDSDKKEHQIDITKLNAGLYLLLMKSDDKIRVKKIIKLQ
jgi:endoglucanase Acf2